jgi:hypothetical protein
LGQWYHIVGTVSSSTSTCRYYINGTLISEDTFTGLGFFSEIQLGAYDARSLPTFNGQLDEVGIWNRALTGSEVAELYNGGIGLTYPFVEGGSGGVLDIFRLLNLPWFITFGGGVSSGVNIARLLNLPWFIKI